jgi:predicted AlkP superfamily pyrophosphatase or phosphodiesterase
VRKIAIAAALAATIRAPLSQAAPLAPPKLAVIIVVDQMRGDYIDRFNGEWKHGSPRAPGFSRPPIRI